VQHYETSIRKLLNQADQLPESAAKLALLEEAVGIADTHNNIDLGIEIRRQLMWVARNLLRGDILTVAFTWCLTHYDQEPDRFKGHDLFHEYEMVIGQLSNLPDISRSTMEEMLHDFGRRLQAAGQSPWRVHYTQRFIAPDWGDRDLARTASKAMHDLRPGARWSNHPDEVGKQIEIEVFLGNEDRALELGERFLNGDWRGMMSAGSFAPSLLLPLHKRQRHDEAARLYKRLQRSFHPERCYYWPYGEMIKWLTLAGDLPQAIKTYEQCQRAFQPFTDPLTRLHFALDAIVLFDRMVQTGPPIRAMRLSEIVPVPQDEGRYRVADLRDWLHREARELAARFDARNGNDYFQQQIHERIELQQWVTID